MGEETALEKLFKSMDKDGDGTVTKEVDVIIIVNIVKIVIIIIFLSTSGWHNLWGVLTS